jgi:hypothetical protein
MMTPNDQRSEAKRGSSPLIISGATYSAVPTNECLSESSSLS